MTGYLPSKGASPENQQDLVMERKAAEWTSRFLAEMLADIMIPNST